MNIDRILVGDGDLGLPPDIWNLPPLPVAAGPYSADWKAVSRIYAVPEWWRDAKFGAWAHWDPQSMPEKGDWYARRMYQERDSAYAFHCKTFGHPSEYGYKDICHNWVIDRWKPDELMDLFVEMGARYFMAMGVHHDNFDCWDSAYQPWNSVRVGPKVDVVGTWEKAAHGAACVSASVFTTLRGGPGASSCRCVTPATRRGRRRACPTMPCKRFWTAKENGGRAWIRWTCMGRSTPPRIRCTRPLPTSSCGG